MGRHVKNLTNINSFNSSYNLVRWVPLFSPFNRWETQDTERLSDSLRITQLACGRARIQTQVCLPPRYEFNIYIGVCLVNVSYYNFTQFP